MPREGKLQNATGREITKCHGKGKEGKFEACIPGNHGKREFPLTPGPVYIYMIGIFFILDQNWGDDGGGRVN